MIVNEKTFGRKLLIARSFDFGAVVPKIPRFALHPGGVQRNTVSKSPEHPGPAGRLARAFATL